MYGGMGSVNKMLIYQNELYIAGGFHQSEGNIGNNIQRWDGSQWRTVGMGTNTTIYDMKIHKNELYIGGQFSYVDNIPAQRIAKNRKSDRPMYVCTLPVCNFLTSEPAPITEYAVPSTTPSIAF